jgi:hypothetical protein
MEEFMFGKVMPAPSPSPIPQHTQPTVNAKSVTKPSSIGPVPALDAAHIEPPVQTKARPLSHSKVTASEIMIAFDDLRDDNDWKEGFRLLFQQIMAKGINVSRQGPAPLLADNNNSIVYINYFGYVCPKCLSIGATYEPKVANANNNGGHLCSIQSSLRAKATSIGDIEKLLLNVRVELSHLLYEISKCIAGNRQLVIVGHYDQNFRDFIGFCIRATRESIRSFERRIIFADHFNDHMVVIDDGQLREYFGLYAATNNTLTLQYHDQPFSYSLWLATVTPQKTNARV